MRKTSLAQALSNPKDQEERDASGDHDQDQHQSDNERQTGAAGDHFIICTCPVLLSQRDSDGGADRDANRDAQGKVAQYQAEGNAEPRANSNPSTQHASLLAL
jgi:hypothetical protein